MGAILWLSGVTFGVFIAVAASLVGAKFDGNFLTSYAAAFVPLMVSMLLAFTAGLLHYGGDE